LSPFFKDLVTASIKASKAALACVFGQSTASAMCAINSALFIDVFFIVLNDRTNLLGLMKQKNILVFFLFFIFPLKPLNSKVFRPKAIFHFWSNIKWLLL
jgi:hypothetical protein